MGKAKKKAKKEPPPPLVSEVDKCFYELQITDLNRKITRHVALSADIEERNAVWEQKFNKLSDERADIIANLKKTMQEKQAEVYDLHQRIIALQEERDSGAAEFKIKVEKLEQEYKVTREQLISEIKLITGKLNNLEEFKLQRELLTNKYDAQQRNIEEQEIKHKRALYEAEKKFITGKETIKKDMEKRLLVLAWEFQQSNDLRIAATTHRVMRENIAINNELDKFVATILRLEQEQIELTDSNQQYISNNRQNAAERDKALSDFHIQRGVLRILRKEHKRLSALLAEDNNIINEGKQKAEELINCLKREDGLEYKVRMLEQDLHSLQCQELLMQTELNDCQLNVKRLKDVMYEIIMEIRYVLKMPSEGQDKYFKVAKQESLINKLLTLMTESVTLNESIIRATSLGTIASLTATYANGDLGFKPKFKPPKPHPTLKITMDSQIGASLEELSKKQVVIEDESSYQVLTQRRSSTDPTAVMQVMLDESSVSESTITEEEQEEEEEDERDESLKPEPSVMSKHSIPAEKKEEVQEEKEEVGEEYYGEYEGEYEVDYEGLYDAEYDMANVPEDDAIKPVDATDTEGEPTASED